MKPADEVADLLSAWACIIERMKWEGHVIRTDALMHALICLYFWVHASAVPRRGRGRSTCFPEVMPHSEGQKSSLKLLGKYIGGRRISRLRTLTA